jgi:hypothetical protein
MRSSVPDGDLARLIEVAVTEKLEKLEAKRLGKTKNPRMYNTRTEVASSGSSRASPVIEALAASISDGRRARH